MTAFDAHWAKIPMRPKELCRHPMDVGLVRKPNGVWGAPLADFDRKLAEDAAHARGILRQGLTP